MRGLSLFLVVGLVAEWGAAQFLNNRPYPTYSLESMPDTGFTCRDKVLGGYYADPETQCQMFHVCVKVAGVGVQDFRFLCPNGTAFDQDHQICAEWDDVDCDATTLYYSSDNFDLYRLGSGFESKAVKYGEEEETFALQRAETGDARLNREHQAQRVNQQKEFNTAAPFRKHNNYQSQPRQDNIEKDIFKGASSSNFYNNKNGGKELDDEYDDKNVNLNQDHDYEQKKKLNRKTGRRPQVQNYNQNIQNSQQSDASTQRPNRPTGFLNNFAGSIVTTPKSASTGGLTNEQYTVAPNRGRNGRVRPNSARQNSDGNNFKQNNNDQLNNNAQSTYNQQFQSPQYTISTPAPFRQTQQTQQHNNIPSKQTTQYNTKVQYVSTTTPPKQQTSKQTENYPSTPFQQKPTFQQRQTDNYPSSVTQPKQTYSSTATQQKQPHTETENYPSSFPKQKQTSNYPTTPVGNNRNTQSYDNSYDVPKIKHTENFPSTNDNFEYKKQNQQFKQTDNYPTTFSPKTNRPSTFNTHSKETYPSTFSPRTNAGYTQISQQTTQQQQQQNTQDYTQNSKQSTQFNTQKQTATYSQQTQYTQNSTPRPSPFTQYTPTVPKISSTTPVTRSNRFDETQYDDGSYSSKYDNYDKKDSNEDEFLKTAHSLNIASSRNELAKSTKLATVTTAKPHYESPRPFSVSANTPKVTDFTSNAKSTTQNLQSSSTLGDTQQAKPTKKKDKNASYDYAYYDSNLGGESEYEIDTEFQKSTPK